jgi:hypothetical protein
VRTVPPYAPSTVRLTRIAVMCVGKTPLAELTFVDILPKHAVVPCYAGRDAAPGAVMLSPSLKREKARASA